MESSTFYENDYRKKIETYASSYPKMNFLNWALSGTYCDMNQEISIKQYASINI